MFFYPEGLFVLCVGFPRAQMQYSIREENNARDQLENKKQSGRDSNHGNFDKEEHKRQAMYYIHTAASENSEGLLPPISLAATPIS